MQKAISLGDILSGKSTTIEELSTNLRTNGWVLVDTTNEISQAVKNYQKDIEKFFIDTTPKDKVLHTEFLGDQKQLDGGVYGYNRTDGFKEGLRLLTGGQLKGLWIPPGCDKAVRHLVQILDSTMLGLIKVTAMPLFKKTIQELASHGIPFLKNIQDTSNGLGPENFAMLDIVYYTSGNPNSTSEVSVASHYDPGLISLNILSTEPGLQFKTNHGDWIDIPPNLENIGVIWTGELAANITQNTIKPAWHRVITPNGKFNPRLSIWIEICSELQDLRVIVPSMDKVIINSDFIDLVNVEKNNSDNNKPKKWVKNFGYDDNHKPMTKIPVKKGEKLSEALWRASQQYGFPPTKSITYYCPVCLSHVHDLMSHFEKEHKGAIEEIEEENHSPCSLF